MLISHKHKFITIDIPKTGSRSLRESAQEWKQLNDILPCTQYSSKTNNPRYIGTSNLKTFFDLL